MAWQVLRFVPNIKTGWLGTSIAAHVNRKNHQRACFCCKRMRRMCFVICVHRMWFCLWCVRCPIPKNECPLFFRNNVIITNKNPSHHSLPNRAPRVRIPFALLHRIAVRNKRVVHFADARKTTSQQIQRLSRFGVRVNGLLQAVYGEGVALTFLTQRLNAMVHPSELSVDVRFQGAG